jgi:hypothetical protein
MSNIISNYSTFIQLTAITQIKEKNKTKFSNNNALRTFLFNVMF